MSIHSDLLLIPITSVGGYPEFYSYPDRTNQISHSYSDKVNHNFPLLIPVSVFCCPTCPTVTVFPLFPWCTFAYDSVPLRRYLMVAGPTLGPLLFANPTQFSLGHFPFPFSYALTAY